MASAALDHSTVAGEFSAGLDCQKVTEIAVDETAELVYVACDVAEGKRVIRRFDYEGNPVEFEAGAPYISGNEIVAGPLGEGEQLADPSIAVDNSNAHNGFLYLVTGEFFQTNAAVLNRSGAFVSQLKTPDTPGFSSRPNGVDVGADGTAYVINSGDDHFIGKVTEFNTSFKEVRRIYTLNKGHYVRVDSKKAAWVLVEEGGVRRISKYEPDQFTTNLSLGFNSPPAVVDTFKAATSPLFADPLLEGADVFHFALDPLSEDLYVDRANRIETYSDGNPEEPPYRDAPVFGSPQLSGSEAIAVTADQRVFAGSGNEVVIFGPGQILPDVHTRPPRVEDVGHTGATVSGRIELAGGPAVTGCALEYGKTTSYGSEAPCQPAVSASEPLAADATVTAAIGGLETGQPYHYRFRATNEHGSNFGIDRTVTPAFVLDLRTLAATAITEHTATLNASLDPDGMPTRFYFEYGPDEGYGQRTEELEAPPGGAVEDVASAIDSLPAGRVWHYRVVAGNANGTTIGPDATFRTAAPPDVAGVRATEVRETSAVLHARIDPAGYGTEYRFEYGTTPAYGQSVPVPDASAGAGAEPVDVTQPVNGLQPNVTYHYRVVATNRWGTSASPDATFDFAPPSCPNAHVREQTATAYLPDCRAYELVSPPNAGAVLLVPGQAVWARDEQVHEPEPTAYNAVQNSGFAEGPSRLSFFGFLGGIAGLDAPNDLVDQYMSTRTATGWVTSLPGLKGGEVIADGREQCSERLDLCIDHDEANGFGEPQVGAPYLFTASGEKLGRLPTDLGEVPGGEYLAGGGQRMSGDFSHFLFAADNFAFAPGGLTGGLGSAYDNDLASGTVTVISKLPGGADIAMDGADSLWQRIEFPFVSPDGSHVLMETPASGGGYHLYMRVSDAVTYDVSAGAGVEFVGATRDGSKVFFTSDRQLSEEDTDTSTDLYMWSEATDSLTLLSKGNGEGNSDECSTSWTSKCGVRALSPEHLHSFKVLPWHPGTDDVIAEESGDVYFYSPENLDGENPGLENQRNLYVYRHGAVHLVATLDPGTEVDRMQISPNGAHAAILTASRLTSYDNHGYREMYAYEPDSGAIRCASCDPSGLPPTSDVEASQGGRFMADDGRVFFATRDALVSGDTDGRISDVYEYVDGRPQLISSGRGSRDSTASASLYVPPTTTGLEAVSRGGRDVYFSTYDTLVPADLNGEYVKFYDARTGGGFLEAPEIAPCAAADECHGPGSAAPAPATVATGAQLAGAGAVQRSRHRAKRRHRKANRKHRHGKRVGRHRAQRRHGRRNRGRRHG